MVTQKEFGRILRTKYPTMFLHPEAKRGEIFIGEEIVENLFYLDRLKESGLTTARTGASHSRGPGGSVFGAPVQPFFVSFKEFVRIEAGKYKELNE